ncbi:MAG: deoxyribodipyrimidine photo-lyase [Cyclobacteriaceae bacterium]
MKVSIHWFRRDLRIEDNAALYHALKGPDPVQCVFIFDTEILTKLQEKKDARVEFIHQEISRLNSELKQRGSSLDVRIGKPLDVWKQLTKDYDASHVYANRDYEPYARERDKAISQFLESKGIPFTTKKDQVIFEKDEVLKKDGTPYTVYTPYSRIWKEKLNDFYLKAYPSGKINNWNPTEPKAIPSLKEIGFHPVGIEFPDRNIPEPIVKDYHHSRDIPAQRGTTRLSLHLRFGTISIRHLTRSTKDLNAKYLNELIWRDFYQAILWHFPHVMDNNFSRKYDRIEWRNNEEEFNRWCMGMTGYPIVDAGMRELNSTGFMHNRVRMIVASFLTKHLLIDWRWGEAYFAEKLLDFDLASNNGGWQWAAGTGVDAAPYFRIFNPYSQTNRFDPKLEYIKKWIPELNSHDYPDPIVDHKLARQRALDTYKVGLQ